MHSFRPDPGVPLPNPSGIVRDPFLMLNLRLFIVPAAILPIGSLTLGRIDSLAVKLSNGIMGYWIIGTL